MKSFFTLLSLVAINLGFTQISIHNSSFENWGNVLVLDSLDGWATSTMQSMYQGTDINNSYQVTNAQDGAYAYHLETVIYYDPNTSSDDTLFGYAIKEGADGAGFTGFPYTDTVDTFTGYFKCDVQVGDTAYAIVELMKNGSSYASGVYQFYGTQSTWTQFSMPILNGGTDEPDSVFIGFASSDPFTTGIALDGSWLEVDNISFGYNAGSMTTPSAIPNYSFEDIYQEFIEQPTLWTTLDPLIFTAGGPQYATKSTDAAVGAYSIQIETTPFNFATNIPSIVTNGEFDFGTGSFVGGTPYGAQPAQLTGQVKYTPSGTDTALVWIEMWNQASGMLVSAYDTVLNAATWTPFSIDLNLTEAPDSMRIVLYSGDEMGSVFLVDDLAFVGGDLSTKQNTAIANWQLFPNPATTEINIIHEEVATIELLDLSGRVIYTENVNNSIQTSIDVSNLPTGIYMVRLKDEGISSIKKLIVE